MDKDSEVTSDNIDEETRIQFLNGVVNRKALSDGGWEINPKYLKKIDEGKGELEDYIFKPDFYIKTVHLLYAESEEGKKKIAIV